MPGRTRFSTGPHGFLRLHISLLVREADPDVDAELLTEFLLAPLTADMFLYCCRVRGFDVERMVAGFEDLVDRLVP